MNRGALIGERLARAGAVVRDLELAERRIDQAREKLGKDNPLSVVGEAVMDCADMYAVEHYLGIIDKANAWLNAHVRTVNQVAAEIEKASAAVTP